MPRWPSPPTPWIATRSHMGIAEQRDAVGPHAYNLRERVDEFGFVLAGQTIDRVDVQGRDAMIAEGVDDSAGFVNRLDAVNSHLHLRVKVLHPDTDAGQACFHQRVDARPIEPTRI